MTTGREMAFQNATVFFIDASLQILQNDWIIGCGVGDLEAAHYKVSIYAGWWGRLHVDRRQGLSTSMNTCMCIALISQQKKVIKHS